MEVLLGTIASSLLWLLATGLHHRHLRLEPRGHFHALFTGDSFFITCSAGEESGATRLTWQNPKGRDITVSTGRVHVEAAPDDPYGLELVFEDVKSEDAGTYVCSAIIDLKQTTTKFMLTVHQSITYWGTPDQQVAKEGTDYMVMCNVRSDPSPIISWYVNGTIINDGGKYTITENGLFVRDLEPRDSGNYSCRAFVVTPHSSQMKEKNISLIVHYRPRWGTSHMEVAHGVIGSSANLTCAAHAQPPPVFEWFRERELLGNSRLYRITNLKWKSILQVKIKDGSVFGSYQCIVSNSMGEKERSIRLVEGIVPSPPEFSVRSDDPGTLIIKFNTPHNHVLPVLGHRIEWKLTTDSDWHQARYHQTKNGDEFLLHDLSFESDYAIRTAAQNEVGYSSYSGEVVHRTKGLVAETVVDGSSVSSSYNSSRATTPRRHPTLLPLVAVFVLFLGSPSRHR